MSITFNTEDKLVAGKIYLYSNMIFSHYLHKVSTVMFKNNINTMTNSFGTSGHNSTFNMVGKVFRSNKSHRKFARMERCIRPFTNSIEELLSQFREHNHVSHVISHGVFRVFSSDYVAPNN